MGWEGSEKRRIGGLEAGGFEAGSRLVGEPSSHAHRGWEPPGVIGAKVIREVGG